jgi:hypothetical protein
MALDGLVTAIGLEGSGPLIGMGSGGHPAVDVCIQEL